VHQNPVEGIDVLTLNNNKQDPALVSQYLAYRLFNAAGVHAPRVNFARVTVNGEYLGIYSNVESIGQPFLKRRFGDSSGRLYEGTIADLYPRAIDRLEAKNKKANDRSKVLGLAELLASEHEPAVEEIERFVDVDNFLRFWAMESLIGFWDGYTNNQNNYWMYEDPTKAKYYFIPWGADAAFLPLPAFFGFGPRGPSSVYAQSMLANVLYHNSSVAERYRETMRQLLDGVWKEDELLKAIDQVENLVADHLPDRQAGVPEAMNGVRQFIRSRRETITRELEDWPAQVASQPRKPTYTVEIGSAKGSFSTEWAEKPSADPLRAGQAELQFELNNETIAFKQLGAMAHLMQPPRFPFGFGPPGGEAAPGERPQNPRPPQGAPAGTPGDRPAPAGFGRDDGPFGQMQLPAMVVITGVRESDGKKVTLTLSVDRSVFGASTGKTIAVRGMLSQGESESNFFMPFGGPLVDGKLTLTKVGTDPTDPVEGEFDVKIVEMRGGFMDRRGR
jgi:hypothetical protein